VRIHGADGDGRGRGLGGERGDGLRHGRLLVVEEILDIYTNGPDIILEVNLAPKCGDYDVPPSFKGRVVTDLRNTFISIGDVRIAIKHMKNCSGQVVIR
jgi:hypothetical protein